jgi:hypothetical protein
MGQRSHAGLSRREALAAIGGAAVLAGALSDTSNASLTGSCLLRVEAV